MMITKTKILSFIKELVGPVLIAMLITVIVLTFIRLSIVRGCSMEPTMKDSQKLITLRTAYTFDQPKRGDIIIADGEKLGVEHIIKRVIGLPGETVEIRNNSFYIDGVKLPETYINEPMYGNDDQIWELGQDEYFICGDNRNWSADSRIIGPIFKSDIFGKVIQIRE